MRYGLTMKAEPQLPDTQGDAGGNSASPKQRPWEGPFITGNPMAMERVLIATLFAAVGVGAVVAVAVAIMMR